ncbi:pyridoxal kinase [Paracoccus spongiarum]|uniref:pyridoxal kinase n=1 Tax=Paracoccus spongiarum TaxID=3064387 RepID=A0ABT9J9I1_9RHOB|nr:pyridoxal kinase [Paracoccus sp. 2205BS29-5]MDP5306472.1 pyridoxal kinase [Paracoccus sp. 2205BS29-5]
MSADPPPLVISIQSQVVHGHVGNSAALFPMQAAGLEVAAIPTVLFSNTPDYPTLRGAPVAPDLFADLLRGAEERGLPQRAAWLLTGYIGSVEVAALTADFVARSKAAHPGLRYLCDPVMGDHAPGLYVPPEIAAILRDRLLPLADLATPNAFELGHLTGRDTRRIGDVAAAAALLRLAPGARVVATGCVLADTPEGHLESVIADSSRLSRHLTPHLPVSLPGTGDLFAGLVVAGLGLGRDLGAAVDLAQRLTGRALAHAARLGAREILLSEPGFRRALLTI